MIRTYVAFDATNDMAYYNTLKMWKEHKNINFTFDNAHELNNLRDGSNEDTIKRKLRERMLESDLLILLVGESTKFLYKFVRWEIDLALELGIPIVVCNLNGLRKMDENLCPPILKNELAIHVPFKARILSYAHDNWPASHKSLKSQGKKEHYIYTNETYEKLGLNETEAEKKAKEAERLKAISSAYALKRLLDNDL